MTPFEIIFWMALLAEIIIRAPVNLRRKHEKFTRPNKATLDSILFGLLSLGMFILPLIYCLTPWLDFANYSLPAFTGWAGALIIAGAVAVFWRAHVDLGANWSPTLETREKHELVTRGIYAFIRHPMYTSQWLWSVAQALLLPNWLAGALNLLIWTVFYALRVGAEEKMMLAAFGPAYEAYMKRTGRVFPRVS